MGTTISLLLPCKKKAYAEHILAFAEYPAASMIFEGVDGRELWMLGDRYEVDRIKEWLLMHCITSRSACAAAQFACDCEEGVCESLLQACCTHARTHLRSYGIASLKGICARAAGELLRAYVSKVREYVYSHT
jgi:hypothetical protein